MKSSRIVLLFIFPVVFSFFLAPTIAHRPAVAAEQPRLIVALAVDQLAYEYLSRFADGFAKNGFFRRVNREGAWFTECHHRNAFTATGPGHSVMLSGAYPRTSGIINNVWYDRTQKKTVYCVTDTNSPLLGGAGGGISPRNLKVTTLGDALKKATGQRAKVFGVAIKDRSAVLMAGKRADGVFWYDSRSGNFISSLYYGQRLPAYVRDFNAGDAAEKYAGTQWNLLYDRDKYRLHRPDDYPFEGDGYGVGRAFPHKLAAANDSRYYKQLTVTPYANDLLLAMARRIVVEEKLGQDADPDLLAIGVSTNDILGHNFGPFSLEVQDMTYRTDVLLGQLVEFLDRQVGRGKWTIALSADHGVAPIPEYAASIGLPAKRDPLGDLKLLQGKLEKILHGKFGTPGDERSYIQKLESNQVYLDRRALGDKHFSAAQQLVRNALLTHKAISAAQTRDALLAKDESEDRLTAALQRSFHPDRSGDVLFILHPHQAQSDSPATHGSPWPYDTHVPLLLLGAGVRPGKYSKPTSPAMLAPTLARLLKIDPPADCVEGPLLESLANQNETRLGAKR